MFRNRLFIYTLVALLTFLGCVVYAFGGTKREKLYSTHQLSPADVAVSCVDGSRPVAQEVATDKRVFIISCPYSAEEKMDRGQDR